MNENYDPPLKVTIASPSEIPKGFGINSTGKYGGNLRIRCTNAEYDMIKEQAYLHGLSISNYCRWCCVHVAQAMQEHRIEHSNEMEAIGDGI